MSPRDHTFSVAPMMDWTDRHCRFLLRLITRRTRLYTEMVTADAVNHGDAERLLAFDPCEHPVALQLGGADPRSLARAARTGADLGYDEINLNVGCPSDRVQSGRFGACLMAEPGLVARCVEAMKRAVDVPVTVKCRIGIDDQDGERALSEFALAQVRAGADALIVHARKAWLAGLSPKQNRQVPPLDHARVHRLKAELPDVAVIVNGGIGSLGEARRHLDHVDGVMLGRAAYQTPWLLADVDREIFGDRHPVPPRADVAGAFADHIETELGRGTPLAAMTRHLIGLTHGLPGARAWRRHLTEAVRRPGAGPEIVAEALALVEDADEGAAARHAA